MFPFFMNPFLFNSRRRVGIAPAKEPDVTPPTAAEIGIAEKVRVQLASSNGVVYYEFTFTDLDTGHHETKYFDKDLGPDKLEAAIERYKVLFKGNVDRLVKMGLIKKKEK